MLYDKPVRVLLEDCVAALGPAFRSDQAVEWFDAHYPRVDDKTVRAHLRAFSANDPNKRHYSFGRGRPALLFKTGRSTYEVYDPEIHGLFDDQGVEVGDQDLEEEQTRELIDDLGIAEAGPGAEFALESTLRNFC